MLSGNQPNQRVQEEGRKCMKCIREMQKLWWELEGLKEK